MAEAQLKKWESIEAAISDAESAYIGAQVEWGRVVGRDGVQIIKDKEGRRGEVCYTGAEVLMMFNNGNAVLFHTHPSGNSFSIDDLRLVSDANLFKEIASGQNTLGEVFRHEIIRPDGGWPKAKLWRRAYNEEDAIIKSKLKFEYFYGRISLDRANADRAHEVMKRLAARFQFGYNRMRLR